MRSLKTFFIIITGFLAVAAHAQNPDAAAIERLARASFDAWKLPSMAVAVVKDDRVIYLKGFGVLEAGGTAPVTPDTLFQIASTSKAFTTTAMAMLVDEKKMSWDDPVRKHVDYFHLADSCADSLVTLRDVVSHRTGLSRHDELWDYGPWTREEVIRRIGGVELSKPFRSAYQYQNIMFMTAGEAVAGAAGMPWEQFVKTRIFEPLGMKRSVISESDWTQAERASSHRYDATNQTFTPRSTKDFASLGPAGSIKSSARDLAQWVRFQLNEGMIDGKRLLSADALKETWKPQTVITEASTSEDNPVTNINTYGLGWRVQDYRGQLLVSHGGALNLYRAQVALLPQLKAGVVVLTNTNRGYGIIALRNAILDALAGKETRDWNAHFLAREKTLDERALKSKREGEGKRHKNTKPSRELASYVGKYSSEAYGPLTVALDNDRLVIDWTRLRLPLVHHHYDTFAAVLDEEDIDELVTFSLGSDGEVKSVRLFGQVFTK